MVKFGVPTIARVQEKRGMADPGEMAIGKVT